MKKHIIVQHTHRYTHQKEKLFEGYAEVSEFNEYRQYRFQEADGTKVVMTCYEFSMRIERFGEIHSCIECQPGKSIECPMRSAYGTFAIPIYTFAYVREDDYVVVSYDVENGTDDKDGFIIEIEEDRHETN